MKSRVPWSVAVALIAGLHLVAGIGAPVGPELAQAIAGAFGWAGAVRLDELTIMLRLSVTVSLTVLLALSAMLGSGAARLLSQIAFGLAGLLALTAIGFRVAFRELPQEAAIGLTLGGGPIVLALLLGAVARRRGWRWRGAAEPVGPPWRFSVRELLLGTLTIAVLFGGVRAFRQVFQAWDDASHVVAAALGFPTLNYVTIAVFIAAYMASGFLAVVASSGPRWQWGFVSSAVIAAGCGGYLPGYLLTERLSHNVVLLPVAGTTAAAALVAVSLALLRLSGWRIDRPAPVVEEPPA